MEGGSRISEEVRMKTLHVKRCVYAVPLHRPRC